MKIRLSPTLARYLARVYTLNLLGVMALLWSLVYIMDTLELLRRASKKHDVGFALVLKMSLLKLPDTAFEIFPFIILFSALYTFWQLNRRHELAVVRGAGLSVWQFISPLLLVAAAAGFLIVTIANPLGAAFVSRYHQLESKYLTGGQQKNYTALFDGGLWLRQENESTDKNDTGYSILHADTVHMPDWALQKVMVLFFDGQDHFVRRLDAQVGHLEHGHWVFSDVFVNMPRQDVQHLDKAALTTDLTSRDIEDSLASPATMSFWKLPAFIRTLESTGFDTARLRIHFQALLALPFMFAAMILLAAAVSLRPPRLRGAQLMAIMGVLAGFGAFFMNNFLQALGISQQIPVILAAWAPPMIFLLLSSAALLSLEDG